MRTLMLLDFEPETCDICPMRGTGDDHQDCAFSDQEEPMVIGQRKRTCPIIKEPNQNSVEDAADQIARGNEYNGGFAIGWNACLNTINYLADDRRNSWDW